MKYITYLTQTGEIKSWGECDFPIPLDDSHTSIPGEGTTATHYVSNGQIKAYTTPQAAAKAIVPDFPADWSNTSFSWVDSRSLEDAKAQTWNTVRDARDENQNAGFVWDGSRFDSDDVSVQRLQGAVQLAMIASGLGQPFSIVWTLYDNTTRTLSGTDMIQVFAALGSFVQSLFDAGVALRAQINAATQVTDLHGIKWVTI